MPEVSEMMKNDPGLIRKWGAKLLALQDYSAPVPTTYFDTDGRPILPASAKILGSITTDGVNETTSVETEGLQIDQEIFAVRYDETGGEKTMVVTFSESSSAWVNAVFHGKQVADWPSSPRAPWIYDDGTPSFPYYRFWLISQDGVGDQAFYRVEYGHRAKVNGFTDRTKARRTAEGVGVTFALTPDPVSGKTLTRAENGPGFGVPAEVPAGS